MKRNDPVRPEPASDRRTWVLIVILPEIPGALFGGSEVISHHRRFFDPRTGFLER